MEGYERITAELHGVQIDAGVLMAALAKRWKRAAGEMGEHRNKGTCSLHENSPEFRNRIGAAGEVYALSGAMSEVLRLTLSPAHQEPE